MIATEAMSPKLRRLIGTSDYAAALGLAEPGPVGIYNEKRHGIRAPRSAELEEMGELGKLTEMPTAIIAARKLRLDASKLEKIETIPNPGGRAWARVSLDPVIRSPATIFECKARAGWRLEQEGWGDAGTDQVPLPIWIQVQGQLDAIHADRNSTIFLGSDLPDVDVVHVAVLVNGQKVLIFPVPRARNLGAELAARMTKFWTDHVVKGRPPFMDHFEGSARFLSTQYPKRSKTVRKAQQHEIEAAKEMLAVRAWCDYYEKRKDTLKHELLEYIGADYGIEGPGFKLLAPEFKGKVRDREVIEELTRRLGLSEPELAELENFHRGEKFRMLRTTERDEEA